MKKIIVTHAVKEEYINLHPAGVEIISLRTSVGKTKSAYLLTKAICNQKPDFVLNIGTAGTLNHNIGDIFIPHSFVDRDYEKTKLPGLDYEIDGTALLHRVPALQEWASGYSNKGVCSTGDTFVTDTDSNCGDIVDMEAYAQAYVCREFDIPFLSVKYITDIIGKNSVQQWEDKLSDARNELTAWFGSNPIFDLIRL